MGWQVGRDVAREDYHGMLLAKEKLTFVGVRKLKTDAGNEYRASDGKMSKDSYSNRIVPWTTEHQDIVDHRRVWSRIHVLIDRLRRTLPVPELEKLERHLAELLNWGKI